MRQDQRFFRFLRERIGLDIASVGASLIERAVQQRRDAAQLLSLDAYWQLLQGSATEQQALIEAVIVPETWFMRYPESFAALARLARARLKAPGLPPTLRILSLPCSTGEEPYSIAMTLLDAGIGAHQFMVYGLDVSPLSVERARQAVYGRNSFRGPQSDFRERYFRLEADGYRLNEQVRDQVRLQVGNVLDPQLLKGEAPYDFVFCRNLLIYFDVPTQQQAFEALKRLTREEGALFIGPAEGSLLARMGMRPVGIAQSFAFVREPLAQALPAALKPASRLQTPLRLLPEVGRGTRMTRPVLAEPPDKAKPVDTDRAGVLASIAVLANEGKSSEARAAGERFLRQYGPDAQVFYWLGLLSDVAGRVLEAQGFYRKALYLEPQHPEALAHLAALLAAQGDGVGARRLQERAARGAANGRKP